MNQDTGLKLDNGVLPTRETDAKLKQSLPERNTPGGTADLPSSNSESVVTSDLDRAVADLEARQTVLENSVSKDNCTSKDLPAHVGVPASEQLNTQGTSTTIISANNDEEEPSRPRDFNELRAIFSQANDQDISPSRRPNSPGLDFTPVKERTFCHERYETTSIMTSNDGHDANDSLVSQMRRNFETLSPNISNLENSQIKNPVSFEIDLENCVTRDCITSDSRDYLPSVENRHERSNASSGLSSIDTNISKNLGTSDEENYISPTGPSDVSRSISFEISFDDDPVRKCVTQRISTPLRNEQFLESPRMLNSAAELSSSTTFEDKPMSVVYSERSESGEKILSKKSYSFEISFDDSSPTKPSKSTSERVIPSTLTNNIESLDASISSLSAVSSSTSPQSLCFEINFGGDKSGTSRRYEKRSSENNECREKDERLQSKREKTKTCLGKHDLDVLPAIRRELELEETRTNRNIESRLKTPCNQLDGKELLKEEMRVQLQTIHKKESSTDNTSYHEIDTFPGKEATNVSTTRGISFEYSSNPNLKLAPEHTRLKMTTTKQPQNLKTPKQPENVNLRNDNKTFPLVKPDEGKRERDTYTLDEVSQTLQNAFEKGLTLEQALNNLSKNIPHGDSGERFKTIERDEHDAISKKRGTYLLDEVSNCLVDAADKSLTVAQALDFLANSEESYGNTSFQGSKVDSSPRRGTYDLDDLSRKIDRKKDRGSSLEEALVQLLDEVESIVSTPRTINRGTYDLEDVSKVVQNFSSKGIPVEESLNIIATSDGCSWNEISSANVCTSPEGKTSIMLSAGEDTVNRSSIIKETRGVYSLDEVAEQLEFESERGNSCLDTLSDISKSEPKDYASRSELEEASNSEEYATSRNTYTLDEVAQSLELAKKQGIPIVQALSNISSKDLTTAGSRGTYTLDEVAQSLESARNKGLPVVLALENLVMQGRGNLRGPAEVALHRRQGKLTNRKTYALASPLETIGEENQLRLFDGISRKLLPPTCASSSGAHVMQTLDLLTSACEALLKTSPKPANSDSEEQASSKADSRDSGTNRGTYSLDDVSESLKHAKCKGIPVVDALESLISTKPVKQFRIPRSIRKAGSKSDSNLTDKSVAKDESSRQTYSLEGVSSSMEAAKAKGIPVIAALDELTNSLAQFSATGAKAFKNGKKPIKKPDRPSIRKREAARLERFSIKSEADREMERPSGIYFPISYPPAMRNSYSLDDVASAFEMAYQTDVPFQEVLDGKVARSQPSTGDNLVINSTGSLKAGSEEDQSHSATSLARANESPASAVLHSSFSEGQIAMYSRKDSVSSEGSISCSSSAGSDLSATKDSSSAEDLIDVRKQRKHSNGPFQLRRTRRNSPANLRNYKVSSVSSQGDSVESLASTLGSDLSVSETILPKRGTYDLKKVSEELDSFTFQGVPLVKGLHQLVTKDSPDSDISTPKRVTYSLEDLSRCLDCSEGHSVVQALDSLSKDDIKKSMDCRDIMEDSPTHPQLSLLVSESFPKRGTYSLEDVGKKLDSSTSEGVAVNNALFELSQLNSTSNDKGTRDTFTFDRVEVSIEDANKRGIPVVDVLHKLSALDGQVSHSKQRSVNSKTKRKPFMKPQSQSSVHGEFFIEYFPSNIETKSPKFKLENGEAVEVRREDTEHVEKTEVEDTLLRTNGHPSETYLKNDTNAKDTYEAVQTSNLELPGRRPLNDQIISTRLSKTQDQTSEHESAVVKLETPLETAVEETNGGENHAEGDTPVKDSQSSDSSISRPRWQRSGSYVEALDSFEEMLDSNHDISKVVFTSTYPNDQDQSDTIPVKDSQYQNETYDTMLPETTCRGHSTWRPSGSILGQILCLMDDAEENGLSIADALEQAAEMSEQQGEIGESKTNDIDDDTANPQHLAVLRLHFEEKRRQIEADKRRSQEQWEEERRRLGETAFWYTIGRAQVGDKDAGNARPGHVRVPTYEPLSPGQPTPPIGRSTPLECMSPIQTKSSYQSLTVEGCHSDSVQVAVGHGYHHAPLHRPGHQSPSQSGFQSPGTSQASFQFPSTSVPEHQPVTTDEFDFHGNRHDHASSSYPDEHEYETHKFRLSDYPPLKTQQDESPSKQSPHQNRPMTSPSRKCWEVNPAVPTEGFITPSTEHVALQVEDTQEEEGDDDNQSKKGFSMFFGDYSAKPKEGLTPEQHKKRERFLRSRQKKQEDEKARKEAENEKKRLRELKQKVLEEQKRLEDEQREEQQRRIKRESLGPIIGGDLTYRPGPGSNQQDDHSAFAEFSGPRCYVKPSGKSNRKLITNAIAHVCLSGTVNKENKEKCLQAIAESSGFHFIVLFKDGLKFRGLYMLNPEIEQAFKVFGIGPKVITSKMVDCVYKYSSGGKEFIKIPSKTLSISVDGVAVQKVYWQTSKPNVASKTQSNLKRTPRPQR